MMNSDLFPGIELADIMPAVAHISKDGVLREANQYFCDILGYSREEVIGFGWTIFVGKEHSQKAYDNYVKMRKSGYASTEISLTGKTSANSSCLLLFVRGNNKQDDKDYILLRPLDDRLESSDVLNNETELHASNRLNDIFYIFSKISHNFNNIFGSVLGYTDLLLNNNELLSKEKEKEYLQVIMSSGHRATTLNNLMDYGNCADKDNLFCEENTVLEDVEALLNKMFDCQLKLYSDDNFMNSIPENYRILVKQAVLNLGIEAIESMDRNTTLEIRESKEIAPGMCKVCNEHTNGCSWAYSFSYRSTCNQKLFEDIDLLVNCKHLSMNEGTVRETVISEITHDLQGHIIKSNIKSGHSRVDLVFPQLN